MPNRRERRFRAEESRASAKANSEDFARRRFRSARGARDPGMARQRPGTRAGSNAPYRPKKATEDARQGRCRRPCPLSCDTALALDPREGKQAPSRHEADTRIRRRRGALSERRPSTRRTRNAGHKSSQRPPAWRRTARRRRREFLGPSFHARQPPSGRGDSRSDWGIYPLGV